MLIKIKKLFMQNFKGCKERTVTFGDKTIIMGANATGKTTVFDAFTWLLFNKNSAGEEKFNVRPLDKDGNRVDNVEIKVVATLDIEGKEVELSKVQRQKWVKKRRTDVSELQGNENLYEVAGYPKSEKDYKDYIAEILDENLFKMITSPYFFTAMKWQDQRNILMQFVTEMSDLEMAQGNPKFSALLMDLENAPTTDDIKSKYQKALSTYKDRQKELPARIDEVSKMKVEVDVAELELQKKALSEKIAACEIKIKSSSKVVDELESQKFELQFEINDCKRRANESLYKNRRELTDKQYEYNNEYNDLHQKISIAERGIAEKKSMAAKADEERKSLGSDYNKKLSEEFQGTLDFDESKWVFDDSSTVCSLCGQTLPEERIVAIRGDFEARKASAKERADQNFARAKEDFANAKKNELSRIVALGNEKKSQVSSLNEEIALLEVKLPSLREQEAEALKQKNVIDARLAELPSQVDLSSNEEYATLIKKDSEFDNQIAAAKANGVDLSEIETEKSGYEEELEVVKAKIAKSAQNVEIDERIAALENEQKEVGQKVADQEKMLYLLEEFIREKMNLISKSINGKFKTVEWKLFEMQINGGMKECCECTVNGVPFSTLNTGHRIVAGLDIISSLSDLYGVKAPIFVDNAEAVNAFNIPETGAQMILLSVTEDNEMKVEVK